MISLAAVGLSLCLVADRAAFVYYHGEIEMSGRSFLVRSSVKTWKTAISGGSC